MNQSGLYFCRVEKETFVFIVPFFNCLGLRIEYLFNLLQEANRLRNFYGSNHTQIPLSQQQ